MNSSSHASSSTSRRVLAGILHQTNKAGDLVTKRKIFADQDIIVGRDSSRCQYTIDDPCVSNKHLRIYTIVYDDENPTEVAPLVYAEDLSRNGTYWNRSLIGKGNGGFLLSDGDSLRLSSSTLLRFERGIVEDKVCFDLTQENEMKAFRKNYVITDRLLGAGGYGKVYMAINEFQRRQLACKIVDLRKLRPQARCKIGRKEQPAQAEDVDERVQLRKLAALADERHKEHLLEDKLASCYREVDILSSINHPNIVGLEKVFVTDNTLYIFQDLVTAGDLFSYLESKNGRLIDVEAAVIVRQIVVALKFLHERHIVHRDIKPDNILMTTLATGCRVVLTDFGGAREIASHRQRMRTLIGTADYAAPEIGSDRSGLTQGYSKAVDMWSLGCVTVVLLTGGSAFRDPRTNQHSEALAKNCNLEELEKSSEWSEVSTRPKAFVGRLLLLDESQRLTAEEALQDPWFNNEFHKTDFEELYKRTIRHWQPKVHKKPIIEFMNAREVKQLSCSQAVLAAERRIRGRVGQTPVEPPYKPFPRQMHQPLFPPRRPSGTLYRMSEEVEAAIREYWSPSSSSDESSQPDLPTHPTSAQFLQQRTPAFQALRRSPSLEQAPRCNTTRTSVTDMSSTPNKHAPLERNPLYSKHRIVETATSSVSRLEYNRPATPRPKSRHTMHTLPLRALSTAAPTAVSPILASYRRQEADHTALDTTEYQKRYACCSRNVEDSSHEAENTHARFNARLDGIAPSSQSPRTGSTTKANSGLKLRTPKSNNVPLLPASSSKKRRMASIYDLDVDEEVEESDKEPKRQRVMWQTVAEAFRRPHHEDVGSSPRAVESTLVPRTPSPVPVRTTRSVYLPRL